MATSPTVCTVVSATCGAQNAQLPHRAAVEPALSTRPTREQWPTPPTRRPQLASPSGTRPARTPVQRCMPWPLPRPPDAPTLRGAASAPNLADRQRPSPLGTGDDTVVITVLANATLDHAGDMKPQAGRPRHADAAHVAVLVSARRHSNVSGALADQPRSPPRRTPPHPPLTDTGVVDAAVAATAPDCRRGSRGCYRRWTVPRQKDWRASAKRRKQPAHVTSRTHRFPMRGRPWTPALHPRSAPRLARRGHTQP